MADKKREQIHNPATDHGVDPDKANALPGGNVRASYMGHPLNYKGGSIGDLAGSQTRDPVGHYNDMAESYIRNQNDPDDKNRAYTPQEAQKAQANVDAQTMRGAAKGVAGAIPNTDRDTGLPAQPSSYKTGGVVRKTGLAMVHQGERIIPKKEAAAGDGGCNRVIAPDAGWLVNPANKGQYTGENAPWRR